MANKGKKISELTALTSASLQTTLVGVDNGTTYKVTLDVLEDAIISMVSRSTDLRLDSLEEYTSSFTQIDIPIGTISSSAQISNFGFISSSHTNIASLNSFTQSQDILNSAFTNGINARLQTSSFNEFSSSVHSEILAATNEQSFNGLISGSSQLTSSYDERYLLSGSITQTTWDNIGGKPDGIVSQSVDIADFTFTPNTIQNSNVTIVASDGDIVLNADGNVYKGSSNAGNGLITDGYLGGVIGDTNRVNNSTGNTITDNLDNIINSIPSISSLNTFTSSQEILNNTFATTGSNILNGNQTINGAFTISTPSAGVPNGVSNWNGGGGWNQGLYSNLATTGGTGTGLTVNVVTEGSGYIDINSITINTPGSGYTNGDVITIDNENNIPGTFTISIEQGSGWFFNSSGSLTTPGDINVSGSIYADNLDGLISSSAQLPSGLISGSSQLTTFETKGSGIISSSAQLPSGLISGSSQLTASYDTRYTLSGSVSAVPAGTISGSAQITAFGFVSSSTSVPAGTISGSSQLTSSFDGRYVQTGSFNTLTASFNSFTASAQSVTTGSNSFNGTQIITGSLIITTGSFVGSQILANTSSLYLTSGSNMYVQNNGVVEITGSLKVSGSANFNVSVLSVDGRSGDEGGEINLAIPVTNTTLQNRVTTDIWQNRFRVFEGSANAKGVFVDLSKAPAGVGGELMWKASGIVNTGVDVILGDLKARIPSTGNKSLQLSTTSGVTYSVHGSGVYSQSGNVIGTTLSTAISITSTPTYIVSGYNFGTAGATDTWVLMDTSNAIAWRITMVIGFAFNNNMISIERLY